MMAKILLANKYCYFILLVSIYILITFQIVAPVSITNSLVADLHINDSQLSLISAAFFLFYGLIQPVAGVIADKYCEKKVLLFSFLGFIISMALFAFSNNYVTAILSRSLIGLFSGCIFIPSLKLLAVQFEGKQFPIISGLYLGIAGAAGTILATTVLSAVTKIITWQNFFLILSIVGIIILSLTAIVFRKTDAKTNIYTESNFYEYEQTGSVKSIIFSKEIIIILLIFFVASGVYVSFQGLWAINYLTVYANLPLETVNWLLISLPIGFFIGSYLGGYLSDSVFYSRKLPLQMALILLLFCWGVISIIPGEVSQYFLILILCLLGFAIGIISPVIYAIVTDVTPLSKQGIVFGIVNPFSILGVFIYQILTGSIINYFNFNEIFSTYSYLFMMIFCFLSLIMIVITSFLMKETMKTSIESSFKYKLTPVNVFITTNFYRLITLFHLKLNRYEDYSLQVDPKKTKY